jgi:hypothetical protein
MKLFSLILIVTILIGCSSNDDNEITVEPKCLQTIIENALQFEPTTPRGNVEKYLYQDNEVLLVNVMNFTDGQSAVINSECVAICSLGGIDGDLNDCEDFENAEFIETIWTDPR